MRRLLKGLGIITAAALLGACGAAPGGGTAAPTPIPAGLQPVYEQAKNEPALTWYSSQDPGLNDAVVAAFQQQYPGVKVESLRLATGPLGTRYAQERQAGAVTAGLVTLADPNFVDQGVEQKWFEKFDKAALPNLQRLPDRFFTDGAAVTGVNVLGIGYNTTEVQNPPKTWEDALAPEYRGKILLGDPRNVPSYVALARVLDEKVAPDFLTRLAGQQPTVVDSMVPGTQQLAAGEAALAFPDVRSVVAPLQDKGAPIDFVVPEPTTGNEFTTLVSAGGASPNAAKLLYDFLFTDAGQEAFNGSTGSSPIGTIGQTKALPAGYVDPAIRELPAVEDGLLSELGLA
ncbi:extracellular solute-binding protein [Pseudonocardia sp. KRD291]|uniref:extracellular solute-binding protein n=1 Tax=Pseudonocardia sp. KRD291 TaxID=2792007 RepID=UPI001C4A6F67|nr:extracellular solute-binding protein [Pseudonocardia sp. KRD291]MBW0101877.1 extracellular solute-binding protein [Pseudonocardia sp. KRD291]